MTGCVGAQLFVAKLTDVLGQYPPPQPSRPAVDLLVTVGQQQEYLLFHNLLRRPGTPARWTRCRRALAFRKLHFSDQIYGLNLHQVP